MQEEGTSHVNEAGGRFPLPVFVDSTMLTTFRACGKKYEYSFLRNLRSPGRSVHLIAGAAFAAGLEDARRYAFSTGAASVDDLCAAAFPAFAREWGDYEPPEGHPKNAPATFEALRGYLSQHHPLLDSIQPWIKTNGEPAVEFTFAIPLPVKHPSGDPFLFVGRFDMLGQWNGLPVVLDEKTTSALGPSWASQFNLRGQFLGYAWACQQMGIEVHNVFVRGISIKKYDFEIVTVPKQYPQWLLERWFEQTCITLEELVSFYNADHFNYNFGDSCSAYGGCLFQPLCEARDPEQWISSYDVEEWQPIRKGQ